MADATFPQSGIPHQPPVPRGVYGSPEVAAPPQSPYSHTEPSVNSSPPIGNWDRYVPDWQVLPSKRGRHNKLLVVAGVTVSMVALTAAALFVRDQVDSDAVAGACDPAAALEASGDGDVFLNEGGNIHPGVVGGAETMGVQRVGGQEVQVPARLCELDPSNPQPFVNDALGLFAAYVSTGDERAMQAFSSDPEVQALLEGKRNYFLQESDNRGGVQWVIFDSPNDPAQFEVSAEGETQLVTLSGGTLFAVFSDAPAWQDPNTVVYQDELDRDQLTELVMYVGPGANGDTTITDLHLVREPVSYEESSIG